MTLRTLILTLKPRREPFVNTVEIGFDSLFLLFTFTLYIPILALKPRREPLCKHCLK